MKFHRVPGLALALVASLSVIGCGQKEEAKPQAAASAAKSEAAVTTVKIANAGPLTGPQAHIGKDNEYGARLAIEELNAQNLEIGGAKVKFELLVEDDQADPRQGTIIAQKFVDEKVNGVVGHLNSGTTIPASKLYADAGIPQITGSSTNPKYTQQGFSTAFRLIANDVQQGSVLGEFAAKQGVKTVAVVDDRTAYGQGLADEFRKAAEAAGVKVVANEYTNDKATDFKAILTKIKGSKPDLLFFGGVDAQAGPMVRQMKELGIKATFLGGDGVCTTELPRLGGPATEGVLCTLPGIPVEKMAKGPAFQEKFKAKFNVPIQLYGPYYYDAVMVLADAMKRAGSVEPAKYLPAVGKTEYEGITAKIAFDERGDLKGGAISFYQYKDGKLAYLETLGGKPASAEKK